jgi:hypothetical protein
MFCTFCGKAYESSQNFCTNCGRAVPGADPGQAPAPATPSATALSAAGAADSPAAPAAAVPYSSVAGTSGPSYPNLSGLGGWLAVVGIALFLNLFFRLHGIFKDIGAYTSSARHLLTNPASPFHIAGYVPLLRFEFSGHTILLVADACLIYLYFSKRRSFPSWYVTYIWAFAVFALADAVFVQLGMESASSQRFKQLMSQNIFRDEAQTLGAFAAATVWTLYMLKSRRVKQTFLR